MVFIPKITQRLITPQLENLSGTPASRLSKPRSDTIGGERCEEAEDLIDDGSWMS
jgi:hypothetical protein